METPVESPSSWGCEHLIDRILIPADVLQRRIAELGAQISRDYVGKDLVLVCVLKGGVMFLTDLMRHITVPHEIDFMAITSYGIGARQSTGVVRILMDLQTNIEGRHVLIVEDIVDSGRTLDHILRLLWTRNPATLRVCALLDKRARREMRPEASLPRPSHATLSLLDGLGHCGLLTPCPSASHGFSCLPDPDTLLPGRHPCACWPSVEQGPWPGRPHGTSASTARSSARS